MTASPQETEPGGQPAAPTALVSWAHANTDWDHAQTVPWEHAVKAFAGLLRTHGVEADVDLFHFSEASIDWTRWGQNKVRTSDFVAHLGEQLSTALARSEGRGPSDDDTLEAGKALTRRGDDGAG